MRTKNSILNILSGILIRFITLIFTFISRTIFIQVLGVVYLGFNGVMTNIFMLLAIAELGIGTAISFSLYKPLASNDYLKINALMKLYKKAYRVVGTVVFILGIGLLPFIKLFIEEIDKVENFHLVYLVFLLQVSVPYFINYKILLLVASQKEYVLTKINLVFNLLNITIQVGLLLLFENYLVYLIGNLLITVTQILYINRFIDKRFPYIKNKNAKKLEEKDLSEIKKNIKAMFFHKIGDFSINGTDNIILSVFISLSVIGVYSNYSMIILAVNGFILVFFNSITASMGNLISTSSNEKKLQIFEISNFIGFISYLICTVLFLNIIDMIIMLWLGKEFLLPLGVTLVLLVNFYITGMRVPLNMMKNAAGFHDRDKYTPLLQSLINLVFSLILVKKFGIIGIFLATIISSLALPSWQRPYLIYKHIFNTSVVPYFKRFFLQVFSLVLIGITSVSINLRFFEEYSIPNLILRLFSTFFITMLTIYVLFKSSDEMKFIIRKLSQELKKWKK